MVIARTLRNPTERLGYCALPRKIALAATAAPINNRTSTTSGQRDGGAVGRATGFPADFRAPADESAAPPLRITAVSLAPARPASAASSASDIATADGYRSAGAFASARSTISSSLP